MATQTEQSTADKCLQYPEYTILRERSVQVKPKTSNNGVQNVVTTRDMFTESKVKNVDKEVECKIIEPVDTLIGNDLTLDELNMSIEPEGDDANDNDYEVSSQSEHSSQGSPRKANPKPDEPKIFLVYEKQLEQLIRFCPICGEIVISDSIKLATNGSSLTITFTCLNGCNGTWKSQPENTHTKGTANIMLTSAISLSGIQFAKFKQFAYLLNLVIISENTYYRIRKDYVFPEIHNAWKENQATVVNLLKQSQDPIMLAGDGRADSPGHSAKYGVYTTLDCETEKIVDFEMVQVTEVANSNAMELEGFKRVITRIEEQHSISVKGVSTDRHLQIKKYMREKQPDKIHQLDPWHLIKNVSKKINKAAKKKCHSVLSDWSKSIVNHFWWCVQTCNGNPDILVEKWTSIVHHAINKHSWPGSKHFKKCVHGRLPRQTARQKKWIKAGSPTHVLLRKLVTNTRLTNDLRLCTQCVSTSMLEVYHSLYLKYLPKIQHFSYTAMIAGTELAALDHNHNSQRKQVQ